MCSQHVFAQIEPSRNCCEFEYLFDSYCKFIEFSGNQQLHRLRYTMNELNIKVKPKKYELYYLNKIFLSWRSGLWAI